LISIDTSVLLGYYNSKAGILTGATTGAAGGTTTATAAALAANAANSNKDPIPTAPWSNPATSPNADVLAKSVLAGHRFIDPNAAQIDVEGASDDYKNLFALYSGLDAMQGLASQATQKGVSALQLTQLQKAFASGMKEITDFVGSLKMDDIRLTTGSKLSTDKTTVGVPATDPNYTTRPIYTGDPTLEVPAFQGDVEFNIAVKQINTTKNIAINLDDMGSTPRTLSNVTGFINDQLKAQGIRSSFAVTKEPNPPKTVQVGDKTVTLPATASSYALTIKGDTAETMTFSAAATAGAVYVSQTAGAPPVTTTTTKAGVTSTTTTGAQTQQITKIQTDTSTTADQPPAAVVPAGTSYNIDGKVYTAPLDADVTKVHATATGSDGSLYVLGDVDGAVDGQNIKGTQDVALMKYDSAGNLLYTRTLGAANSATGLALAVSSTGQVAIAGSSTGALDADDKGDDPTKSDSFVTVFDASGNEQWTKLRGARENDQATAVAFGDDGTVYVAGQSQSNMPGAAEVGGQDGYLEAFKWNGKAADLSVVTPVFTTQFGSTGADKVSGIAISGSNVVIAGTDGADAVVRQFSLNPTGAPTLTATRDLGDLQGGGVIGVGFDSNGKVVVAGTAHNAALDAGTVTNASSGGSEAFVARLDAGLAPSSNDVVSYFGGSGDDTATGMAIQGTDVWLTGQVGSDLDGTTAVGKKDGYVARIDPSTGDAGFVRRFSATDGQTIPSSIAVDNSGSSALDRLGLPKGTLAYTDSQLVTAQTSLRAGDQFAIRTREGGTAGTVTIAANDTMTTLAQKVARASDFQATVTVVTLNGQRQLQIKPLNDRSTIEILPGPNGKNALGALGLETGVVQTTSSGDDKADDAKAIYGLKLDPSMNLTTPDGAQAASVAMQAALTTIRAAYQAMTTANQPAAAVNPGKTGGTVPAYLTAQIASYQAALNRLTGGAG
jgi:hypothetical protein